MGRPDAYHVTTIPAFQFSATQTIERVIISHDDLDASQFPHSPAFASYCRHNQAALSSPLEKTTKVPRGQRHFSKTALLPAAMRRKKTGRIRREPCPPDDGPASRAVGIAFLRFPLCSRREFGPVICIVSPSRLNASPIQESRQTPAEASEL
jgi:hypothetical protein